MSLPNFSSESTDGGSGIVGMPVHADVDSRSLPSEHSGYRAASDLAVETGLDSFVSEDVDIETSARGTTAASEWTLAGDANLVPRGTRAEQKPGPGVKVLSMATRALSLARVSVSGVSGRARIAAFVPRVMSTAALVGQTGARVTHSLSATLTRPRWRVDPRLAVLLSLSIMGFGELWWLTQRLETSAAESLAKSAAVLPVPQPVVQIADVVSGDGKGSDPIRMRVTFRSTAPARSASNRKTRAVPSLPAWVSISAALPVEIYERGQLIGTSWSGGMRLTPGPHDLRIVNRSAGIDLQKSVEAASGGIASLSVDFPPGLAQITAVPWAMVEVDGVAFGRTPLTKVELSPGQHEVVFKHPKFGQQKRSVNVTSGKPLKISANLARKGR